MKEAKALNAGRVTVRGVLFLRDAKIEGEIVLSAAEVGSLVDGDDLSCWQDGRHSLDGFRYDRIAGCTAAERRIAWLKLQWDDDLKKDFKPQPWEQLIKILREMGHPAEASEVAIAKQEQMRAAGLIKGRVRGPLHWIYGALAGYGHRPLHAVGWMITVWLLCSVAFYGGRHAGLMGPSDPLIHASAQWDNCGAPGEMDVMAKQKPFWTSSGCTLPSEYTTLQPALYSLDLILPLVDLQQETDWSPIVSNEAGQPLWAGHALRVLMWFEILFGWSVSLMLVAVLGRLVEKD